jgi:hypothetical protein
MQYFSNFKEYIYEYLYSTSEPVMFFYQPIKSSPTRKNKNKTVILKKDIENINKSKILDEEMKELEKRLKQLFMEEEDDEDKENNDNNDTNGYIGIKNKKIKILN